MLKPKQQKCIILLVAAEMTQKQIAEQLHVSENTIVNWKKNPEFHDAYTASLKDTMKDVAAKAFKTEISLLKARSEMVRLLTAKDILDRAGFDTTAEESLQLKRDEFEYRKERDAGAFSEYEDMDDIEHEIYDAEEE